MRNLNLYNIAQLGSQWSHRPGPGGPRPGPGGPRPGPGGPHPGPGDPRPRPYTACDDELVIYKEKIKSYKKAA